MAGFEKRKKKGGGLPPATVSMKEDLKRWEAEDDLRAMARAMAVKADPERMKRACSLAKEKIEENKGRQKEADFMVKMGEGKMA